MPNRWWAAQRLIRFEGSSHPPCERNLMWCSCTAGRLPPGDLTEVPVALAETVVHRVHLLEDLPPRLDEVLRQPDQAFSGRQPALRQGAHGPECRLDDLRDADRHPGAEGPARAHLHLLLVLHRATQRDARHGLGLLDPGLELRPFPVPRDQPRLLVADPLLAQRLPQRRLPQQDALERDALPDRALAHSQLLLAVMAEAGEAEDLPGAARFEEHRHAREDLVPAVALLHEALELRVDAPRIDLAAELLGLQGLDVGEVLPLPVFLLQVLHGGLELV